MTEFKTLDSGQRQDYESGMRRDLEKGKARPDLIPWELQSAFRKAITKEDPLHAELFNTYSEFKEALDDTSGIFESCREGLLNAVQIIVSIESRKRGYSTAALYKELGELYARGAEKYGENNWQLASSKEERDRFIRSGLRHLTQYLNGEEDEAHHCAVLFNMAAAWRTNGKFSKEVE
jgi:hypothetical protein